VGGLTTAEIASAFIVPEATVAARECYQRAARMTASVPEQRYLALRAARLAD
jgi:predicted RNA polymerase sigma factor